MQLHLKVMNVDHTEYRSGPSAGSKITRLTCIDADTVYFCKQMMEITVEGHSKEYKEGQGIIMGVKSVDFFQGLMQLRGEPMAETKN